MLEGQHGNSRTGGCSCRFARSGAPDQCPDRQRNGDHDSGGNRRKKRRRSAGFQLEAGGSRQGFNDRRIGSAAGEDRNVGAARNRDDHRVIRPGAAVVSLEAASQPPDLDPNDGVDARVVAVGAVEHLRAKHVFLELIAIADERSLHEIPKHTAVSPGADKRVGSQDPLELLTNVVLRGTDLHENL